MTAGANVVVSGTGAPGNPYVVSASAPGVDVGYLQVLDTATINHTLGGTGTQPDPYELSSAVKLDPDPGNLLQVGPGGLLVSCAAVQGCVGAESPGEFEQLQFECGFDGAGTLASPYETSPTHRAVSSFDNYAGPFNFPGQQTPILTRDVTNPSDCFPATVFAIARATSRFQVAAGNRWELGTEWGQQGSPLLTAPFGAGKAAGSAGNESGMVNGNPRPLMDQIGPSDMVTYQIRAKALDGLAGDTWSDVNLSIHLLCIVNPG